MVWTAIESKELPGGGVSSGVSFSPLRSWLVVAALSFANLLGYSAGPLQVAWLTENTFGSPDTIVQSLALAPPATMIAGLALILLALKRYLNMLQKIETESQK